MYKWVEINLDAIAHNFQKIREFVPKETKILGVVKADAYGHGAVEVSQELERLGIDYLGVTEIGEGLELRRAGIKTPILIFGPILPEDVDCLQKFQLTISLNSLEFLKFLVQKDFKIKVHLKIETGLGRTGLKFPELAEMVEILKENDHIEIEGIYTHLATAMWNNPSFSKKQYTEFIKAVQFIEEKGIVLPLKHIANSAALSKFPEMHLDMVRAGTILYGQEVSGKKNFMEQLEDAWSLKGRIIYKNRLPKGYSVGYERTYVLKKDAQIAIVPLGFAHGFSVEPIAKPKGLGDFIKVLGKAVLRFLNHSRVRTYVDFKGKKLPIIGKVGMQLTMLDASPIPDLKVGDTVKLPGRRTNISPLIPKVFLKEGKQFKICIIHENREKVGLSAK